MNVSYAEDRVRKSEYLEYVAQLKFVGTKPFIDLRKWRVFPGQSQFIPAKNKYFCISVDDWKRVLAMISKMIDENSK